MGGLWIWLIVGAALILAGAWLVWWLVFETEGVYLGRRVVIALYDLYAKRYDQIKAYDPAFEYVLLAVPLMQSLAPHRNPLVLDAATGTGRLPLALLDHSGFEGHIVGVDLSRPMLLQASEKLAENLAYVDLLHCAAECLPFPSNTFDLVTCLEALEFTPQPNTTLKELVRVLRPGGVLLITQRLNRRTMRSKVWTEDELRALLHALGIVHIEFEAWQTDYTKVWGKKHGESAPRLAQPLEAFLRCAVCQNTHYHYTPPYFECGTCGHRVGMSEGGIVELAQVQRC